MSFEVFEVAPGRWAFRADGVYQECDPDLPGCAAMSSDRARACASRVCDGTEVSGAASLPPITAAQMELALIRVGLIDAVEAAVAASGRELQARWRRSTLFHRHDPMVLKMVEALGATPDQADAVWRIGAKF